MDTLAERVDPRLVARLLEQLARQVLDEKHMLGLDSTAWAVLRFVGCERKRRLAASSVSRYLHIDEARASKAISTLASFGLISILKTRNSDQPETFCLSEAGQSILKQDPVDRLARSVSELKRAEQAQLAQLVELLQDRIYRSGASLVPGQTIGAAK